MKRLSILWLALLTGSLCFGQNYPPARWVEANTNWSVLNPTNSTVQGTLDFIDSYWLDGLYTNAWKTIFPTNTKVQGALNWLDTNVGLIRGDMAAVSNAQNTINSNFTTISNGFVDLQEHINTNAWLSSSNAYIANWNQNYISNQINALASSVYRSLTNFPGMSNNPAITNAGSTNFGWNYAWRPEGTNYDSSDFVLSLGYVDLASMFVGWTTNYAEENFYSKQTNDLVIPVPLGSNLDDIVNAQSSRIMRNGATVTYQFEAGTYVVTNGIDLDDLSRPFIGDYELIVAGHPGGTILSATSSYLNNSVVLISEPNCSKATLYMMTIKDSGDNTDTNRLASLGNYGVASFGGNLWVRDCITTNTAYGVSVLRPGASVTFASGTNKVYALKTPVTAWAGTIQEQWGGAGSLLLSLNPANTHTYAGFSGGGGALARGGNIDIGSFLTTSITSDLGVGTTNSAARYAVHAVAGGHANLGSKVTVDGRFSRGLYASFDGFIETKGGGYSTVGAGSNMSSHAVLADMGGSFAGWAGAFSTWTNGSPTVYALSQGTIYLASTNLISPMVIAPATNGFSSDNGAAIWIP